MFKSMAPWPSGKAKVCNTSTPSPNLGGASKKIMGTQSGTHYFFAYHSLFRVCSAHLCAG